MPRRLVPDNLRTGVERTDLYDPKINRSYAELAAHYATLVDPARRGKPKDKPRVERPMPYIRDSFWRGREFTSLQQMQQAALAWCTTVAGRRSSRALQGASPLSVFAEREAAALAPLPRRPFELATWSRGTIGPDIHLKVGKTLYSVPWRHMGRKVDARTTAATVQIFDNGELIATHPFQAVGKRTEPGHYPPEKVAFQLRNPDWCRTRATELGEHVAAIIEDLLQVNAIFRLRAAQKIIALADTYDPVRLDAACAKATAVGDLTLRTVKGLLAAGLETDPVDDDTRPGDGGAAAFLHGPSRLFVNVVAMPTADEASVADTATTDAAHPGPGQPGRGSDAGVSA
ncbi:Mu transposase domain-containing protein [Prauserella flavalba]|uniref:Integrase catalytic domain-containing protein n=1 Tax=Prauserella flavalba TaxID=1477506 RepID=A0A318LFH2_9PSEU|nr:IS21 family transposase [Prauserella flavalba]PXY16718.1 hypothetical protein BA062_38660 [Prauserella flavalba]